MYIKQYYDPEYQNAVYLTSEKSSTSHHLLHIDIQKLRDSLEPKVKKRPKSFVKALLMKKQKGRT